MKRGVLELDALEFNLIKTASLTLPGLQPKISAVDPYQKLIDLELSENEVETILDALPPPDSNIPATVSLRDKLTQIIT